MTADALILLICSFFFFPFFSLSFFSVASRQVPRRNGPVMLNAAQGRGFSPPLFFFFFSQQRRWQ